MEASQQTVRRLFNYRPIVVAAFGFCAGIFLADSLSGIWRFGVMCLFCMLLLLSLLLRRYGTLLFFAALLLGMQRMMLFLTLDLSSLFAPLSDLSDALFALREKLIRYSNALFFDNAPLLCGMLWGDKSAIAAADYAAFRTAGIAHVLALSGLHVSFFAGALLMLIPKRKPRLRFIVTAAFLLLYCAIAAFPASLVRASVMTLCLLGASLAGRRGDMACSLSLSALIILFFTPNALFDIGFQLSFAAVGGVAMLRPPLMRALAKWPAPIAESISITLSATIGTLPLSMARFLTIPTYSLLSNFLLLPLIPFAIIPAFCAVALYPLSPAIAQLPAFIAYHILSVIKGLCYRITLLPGSLLTLEAPPSALFCVLCYMAMLLCSDYLLRDWRYKRRALLLLLPLLLLGALRMRTGMI